MLKKYQILLLFTFIFSITACQQPEPTRLSSAAIQRLSQQDIVNINVASCQQQDKLAVMPSPNHPLQQRLDRLSQIFPSTINGIPLNFRVYLHTEPNAWSSLNGCIRVHSGLLKRLTDEELQGVLAHEIGHIALNHSSSAFYAAQSVEIAHNGEMTLIVPSELIHQQEFAADSYAVVMLSHLKIDTNSLLTMLNKIGEQIDSKNSRHPSKQLRIANIQQTMAQLKQRQLSSSRY